MKKIILIILLLAVSSSAFPQAIHIFNKQQETPDVYLNAVVDSIKLVQSESGSSSYEYVLYTSKGIVRYNEASVDSIKFNMSHLQILSHECKVPNDGVAVTVRTYFSGSDKAPVMQLPNGEEVSLSELEKIGNDQAGMFIKEIYSDNNQEDSPLKEIWYITDGERKDSINIEYTKGSVFKNQWNNLALSADECEYKLIPQIDGVKLSPNFDWADWRYDEDGNIILKLEKNDSDELRQLYLNPHTDNFIYTWAGPFYQVGKFKHTAEEHMQALKDFYESTNLSELDKNWFSDKPLWEWEHLNNNVFSLKWFIEDHVVNLSTGGGQYTGITGTIPPTFEVFMDEIDGDGTDGKGELELSQCALFGKIPANVKNNPKWQKFGWNLIDQRKYYGGGFDFEDDSNLYLDDAEVVDFISDKATTVYEVLSKNKLTWVFNGGAVDLIGGISDDRVNLYLDYKDKGLGIVATVGGYWDVTYDAYKEYVLQEREINGLPEEILWTKGFDKADLGGYGSMSLIDDNGKLIWYGSYDNAVGETAYHNEIAEVLQKYLGDPISHPIYSSTTYESTDFSRDGEVMTLQTASVGNGIDLVITGDMFVDKDLGEGGVFEEEAYKAMEYFFGAEPYATLRDRFNVYAVKAVSINDYRGDNHAINEQNENALKYVSKVPNVDIDNVTVVVLSYDPNYQFFMSGITSMLDSGASIAYLSQGNASEIIVHEAGGHGFAKLLDEYIYPEFMENRILEEDKAAYIEFIKSYYHDRGWGQNVSTTDDPNDVPWSKFLKDDRYSDEVGIYLGAWIYPYDMWRSSENSAMNTDYGYWFNAPSREAIYKRIMELSEGGSWTYDYEEFVHFDQQVMAEVKKKAMKDSGSTPKRFIHKAPELKHFDGSKVTDIELPFKIMTKECCNNTPIQNQQSMNKEMHSLPRISKINANSNRRDRAFVWAGEAYYDLNQK